MKEFCALRAKTYAYLMNDDSEYKKRKRMKKCVIKRRLMFENYTENIDEHNVDKENKILIAFDDMITNMINHKS